MIMEREWLLEFSMEGVGGEKLSMVFVFLIENTISICQHIFFSICQGGLGNDGKFNVFFTHSLILLNPTYFSGSKVRGGR